MGAVLKMAEYKAPKRRISDRLIKDKKTIQARARRRPIGEVAAERLKELIDEIANDMGSPPPHGWKAEASRMTGIPYKVLLNMVNHGLDHVSAHTINVVAKKIGCDIGDLCDDAK